MVLFFLALNEHVIDIYFHVPPNLFAEHLVYQSLVCGPRILQSKGHDPVAVETLAGDQGCLFLIFLGHLYLVVPGKCVHESQEFVSDC